MLLQLSHSRIGRLSLIAGVALVSLSGCVSTSLIDRWKDPSYTGPPLHKVLVVGVQRDDGRRRLWEDGMVVALTRQGVQATASYAVFPNKAPNADELATTASREGFDGVLASHFVGASQRNYWMPGLCGGWIRLAMALLRVLGYRLTVQVTSRPSIAPTTRPMSSTSMPSGGRLIWTGITRSVDLSSTHSITDDISRVLVPALVKQGILAAKGS